MKKLNLIGRRFNRLTVIAEAPTRNKRAYWICQCECGGRKIVGTSNLKSGKTQSCGCFQKERAKQAKTVHGGAGRQNARPEYSIWLGVKKRCLNPKNQNFAEYGERGITICKRWLESFGNFYLDMGARPTPKHTLDRIDVNGDYEASNCRWATRKEQANNTRRNLYVEHEGKAYSLAQLAAKLGLEYQSFYRAVRRRKMPLEQAIASAKKLS